MNDTQFTAESLDALEAAGIRSYFRVVAISEMIELKKPDPAIFRWALREAECSPSEALMVGDRIDNDVVPARALGIRAIWFHVPHEAKGWIPSDGTARLHFESQRRVSVGQIGPKSPEERPDGEARSAEELVCEVRRLRELSRPE